MNTYFKEKNGVFSKSTILFTPPIPIFLLSPLPPNNLQLAFFHVIYLGDLSILVY